MKFTDVFNRSNFEGIISAFPGGISQFFKDPILREAQEIKEIPSASAIQMVTDLIFLSALGLAGMCLTIIFRSGLYPGIGFLFSAVIYGTVLVPILMAAGSFCGFLCIAMLGFDKGFSKYASILHREIPVICLAYFMMNFCGLVECPGRSYLQPLIQLGLSALLIYRQLKLCGISQKRIVLVNGVVGFVVMASCLGRYSVQSGVSDRQAAELARYREQIKEVERQVLVRDEN